MDQKPEDSSNTPPSTPESEAEAAPEAAPETTSETTPAPAAATANASALSSDSKNMGMLCHLLAFSGFLVPFGSILGPLVIWLMKKDADAYVDQQGKESLNFQISVAIYGVVCGILALVVIGLFLLPVLLIGWLVLTIIGTVKASKGEPWQYPVTIRLIK